LPPISGHRLCSLHCGQLFAHIAAIIHGVARYEVRLSRPLGGANACLSSSIQRSRRMPLPPRQSLGRTIQFGGTPCSMSAWIGLAPCSLSHLYAPSRRPACRLPQPPTRAQSPAGHGEVGNAQDPGAAQKYLKQTKGVQPSHRACDVGRRPAAGVAIRARQAASPIVARQAAGL
jgi:hypothetical protein